MTLRQRHLGTMVAIDIDSRPRAGLQDPDLQVDLKRGTWWAVHWGARHKYRDLYRPHIASCNKESR